MRAVLASMAAVSLLSGCTLIPDYERPAAPVAETWPQSAPTMEDAAGDPAAEPPAWQEYFVDPRLRATIDRALEANRDLRVASLEVERAAALLRIQRAELTPAIGVQAAGQRMRRPEAMTDSGQAEIVEQYSVDLGFLSWEIDLFGRLRSLRERALEQYLASEEVERGVRASLIAAVAGAWLQLAADSANLRLAEATVEAQERALALIRARRDVGMGSDLEVHQALSQVEVARVARAEFAGAAAVARNALDLLTGAPVPEELLPEGDELAGVAVPLHAGLPSDVLLERPDVLAAERLLRSANADIGVARAAFFPRISLTAALGTLSPDLSGLFGSDTRSWQFAPQIQAPLFAGGGLRANLRAVRVQREIAVARYEQAIRSAFTEVADGLALRATLVDQLEAHRRLTDALAETLRLSQARYEAGVDGYLGVLVAQRALYDAQRAEVGLHLAAAFNRVQLYKALGGGA